MKEKSKIEIAVEWVMSLFGFKGGDRVLHLLLCIPAPLLFGWGGAAFSAGAGLGKEVGDHFNPKSKFDVIDLVFDGIGIVIGLITHHYIFK